jgi:hypothetical protein
MRQIGKPYAVHSKYQGTNKTHYKNKYKQSKEEAGERAKTKSRTEENKNQH